MRETGFPRRNHVFQSDVVPAAFAARAKEGGRSENVREALI